MMILQSEVVLVSPSSPRRVVPLPDDEAERVVAPVVAPAPHQGLLRPAAAAARRPGQAAVVGRGVGQLLPVDVGHRGGQSRLSVMLQVRRRSAVLEIFSLVWCLDHIASHSFLPCPELVMPSHPIS